MDNYKILGCFYEQNCTKMYNVKKDDKEYVFKVLTDFQLQNGRDEAMLLSSLNHPNIVKIIEWFEQNNTITIVLEKLQPIEKVFKESKVNKLLDDITNALQYIHSLNYMHYDVRPNNIMKRGNDYVLIDFGICTKGHDYVQDYIHLADGVLSILCQTTKRGLYKHRLYNSIYTTALADRLFNMLEDEYTEPDHENLS